MICPAGQVTRFEVILEDIREGACRGYIVVAVCENESKRNVRLHSEARNMDIDRLVSALVQTQLSIVKTLDQAWEYPDESDSESE